MFHEIQVSLDITPGLHFLVFSFGLSFDYLSFIIRLQGCKVARLISCKVVRL